jgi:GNAT superfamily N-acetyltransferase
MIIIKYLRKKIERNLRDYGLTLTLFKGLPYLLRLFCEYKKYIVYKIDLGGFTMLDAKPTGFDFHILEPHEHDIILQVEELEEWLYNKLEEKLRGNSFCLVVMDGVKLAAFNLVTMNEVYMPLIKLRKSLRPGCAWSEQITVQYQYRKNGLGTELRHRVYNELKRRGVKKFYGGTLACNRASINLARSAGFDFLVDITYRRFLTFRYWGFKRARI